MRAKQCSKASSNSSRELAATSLSEASSRSCSRSSEASTSSGIAVGITSSKSIKPKRPKKEEEDTLWGGATGVQMDDAWLSVYNRDESRRGQEEDREIGDPSSSFLHIQSSGESETSVGVIDQVRKERVSTTEKY
jgi:hypothetical protein